MAKIVATGRGVAVVVNRDRNTAVIRPAIQTLRVPARDTVNTVRDRASTVQVGTIGVQGPKGERGDSTDAQRIADVDLGGHRIVRSTSATGVGYADCNDATHGDDTLGMTTGAALAGAAVAVQREGPITFNGWTWTPGLPVFLGSNGQVTQTPDDAAAFEQIVGYAESATVLNLRLAPPIYSED